MVNMLVTHKQAHLIQAYAGHTKTCLGGCAILNYEVCVVCIVPTTGILHVVVLFYSVATITYIRSRPAGANCGAFTVGTVR